LAGSSFLIDDGGGVVELLFSFWVILSPVRPFEVELLFLFAICPLLLRPVVCISLRHVCWQNEPIKLPGLVLDVYSDLSTVEAQCVIKLVVLALGLVSMKRTPHDAKLFVEVDVLLVGVFCTCGLLHEKKLCTVWDDNRPGLEALPKPFVLQLFEDKN
jgi:hypothetical protein